MGRYLRKCKKVVGEIAVVGVKTRARAALAMAAASSQQQQQLHQQPKKIKKVSKSSASSSYDINQLRKSSRRSNFSAQKNFVGKRATSSSEKAAVVVEDVANCSSSEAITTTTITTAPTIASSSDFLPPCCSSNNDDQLSSSEFVKDRFGKSIVDPEVESGEASLREIDCERATPSETTKSDDQESPASKLPEPKSTVQIKMPSDSEIEDFFTAAEKDLHKRFIDKYNFDIVKDVPLEGRYEWVQIEP